jgi:hypothetical protein
MKEILLSENAHSPVLFIFFVILILVPFLIVSNFGASPETNVVEARETVALKPASSPNLKRALDLIDQGKYIEGAEILINLYTSASFVNKFETAASDQFPLRLQIIQFSKGLERGIIKLAYGFLPDKIIPADMTRDIYFDSNRNQLIYVPSLFNETTQDFIDERIENYEDLIQAHPDKNFYLYYHEILENSKYHPLNPYFSEADKNQSFEYFENSLPDGLVLEKFMLNGMEDHLKYYYRTDHHWNIYGVLRAYEDMYHMLANNYPDMSPILEIEDIVEFPEIEFLGSLSRETLFPIDGDEFWVEVVDFPAFEIIKSGQKLSEHPRWAYFEDSYSTIPYTNHFNEFYGKVTDLIEYTFTNGSDRNLLIIGSSFRNALDPLLGSHYHKTYCIDLRYYTEFSLSEFLEEHSVDDILILGDDEVAFEDIEYWKINP